jgi:hypothetical protein
MLRPAETPDTLQARLFTQNGFDMKVWLSNAGTFECDSCDIVLEYPAGSGIEHLAGGGIWIGAITHDSTTNPPSRVPRVSSSTDVPGEFSGVGGFFRTSIDQSTGGQKRKFDDDADGLVDEDELDGEDNDGDGEIDEDYGAVSESDVYVGYVDTIATANHRPLGLKIWQRSFSWRDRIRNPILPMEYTIVNIGTETLDSLYFSFYMDPDVGPIDAPGYFSHNSAGYLADVRTVYVSNPQDRPPSPLGITLVRFGRSYANSSRYTFAWFSAPFGDPPVPGNDEVRYSFMTSGTIPPDQYPEQSDCRFLISVGPVDGPHGTVVRPGDTLTVSIVLVSGDGLREGPNNLRDNAASVLAIPTFSRPIVPPSPPLRVVTQSGINLLSWAWRPGDGGADPLETWDYDSPLLDSLPDTHWRRSNPPGIDNMGGRVFAGYRIYRSTNPSFDSTTFGLMREIRVDEDLGPSAGLETEFADTVGYSGRGVYYAVTSFRIPHYRIVETWIDSTTIIRDTLEVLPDYLESALSANVVKTYGTGSMNKVSVVPNPYRGDMIYSAERGGYEGLERLWTPENREVHFVGLPSKATIRIFSLAGDLVATIQHEDDVAGTDRFPGEEPFRLFSESGKPLASGIFVYHVESESGNHTGTFVIIK